MRKSNNSRRSNWSQIVRKQKTRLPSLRGVEANNGDGLSSFRKKREEKTKDIAKLCWNISWTLCSTLCLAPITPDGAEFRAKPSALGKRVVFYIIATWMVLIVGGHKYIIVARRLFSDTPLDAVTCFCMLPCVIYGAYTIFAVLLTFKAHETTEIIKGWKSILSEVSPEDGPWLSPFDDPKACMSSIQIFVSIVGGTFGYTVTCVALPDLPFLVAPTLEELGWIDRSHLGSTLWGILLSPVETLLYLIPLLVLTFACQIIVLEVGVLKIFIAHIGKETTDIPSHERQLGLYNRLRVSMITFTMWLKSALVPLLFCIGAGVVFLTYLPLRNDTLPSFIVFVMGYTAVVILVAVFVLTYDVVSVVQGSEEIIKNLQSRQHEYYTVTPSDVKAGLLKAARALKPLELRVGNFDTFGFGVTQVIYEEILNQLLFLLTL